MKWIDVNDRLPKSEETVLITVKEGTTTECGEVYGSCCVMPAFFVDDNQCGGDVDFLWYPHFYDGNLILDNSKILAWMPFPEPYKEEDANA